MPTKLSNKNLCKANVKKKINFNKKCIFCKSEENLFRSMEHIIPESLGNTELILEKGIVCDKCNNGILAGLDNALTDFDPFLFFRTINGIKNKKGNIPISDFNNIHIENASGSHVEILLNKKDNKYFEKTLNGFKLNFKGKKLLNKKNLRIIARALYKIGLELMCLDHGVDFVLSPKFDEIREIILGNKDFNGYFILGVNKNEFNLNHEASVNYKFCKINSDEEEFAIFEFNYYLIKILFDFQKRLCLSDNMPKLEGFTILKF